MTYYTTPAADKACQSHTRGRLIQPDGILAGKLGNEWYGPTTLCRNQALAEVLIKQFGTTFK